MRKPPVLAIGVCLTLLLLSLSPSVSAASTQQFKNCVQLIKKYKWGVALNRAVAKDLGKKIYVNPSVYRANKTLDFDKDGVICENEKLQYLIPTTTTTYVPPTTAYKPPTTIYVPPTTAYIAPTTTVVARPSGTWNPMWMTLGAPNDSTGSPIGGPGLNVVYGERTELIFCLSSGENPSTLEVKDGGVWRIVASGFRQSSDAGRCSNPAEPITFSFYWVVDANGTKNFRRNGKEYKSRDLEIKLTTSAGVQPMLRSVGSIAFADIYDFGDSLKCSFGETSYC